MKLGDFFDLSVLQRIQDRFSNATGLAAIAVDAEGNYITKGSNFTDFCMKYTRESKEGLKRCIKCDNECTGTYYCHAGLMDFAADIIINDEKVGAIIGGQVLPKEPDLEYFTKIAQELGIDEEKYLEALKKVPIRSEKSIRASADMLKEIVNSLVNLEYFKYQNRNKILVYDKEVETAMSSIHEIKSKMKDLQNVATMENMLSLNASIEAGRAGQLGVGFAVVAKEIGSLSKQSSKVYVEIQNLVSTIERSVSNMEAVK